MKPIITYIFTGLTCNEWQCGKGVEVGTIFNGAGWGWRQIFKQSPGEDGDKENGDIYLSPCHALFLPVSILTCRPTCITDNVQT